MTHNLLLFQDKFNFSFENDYNYQLILRTKDKIMPLKFFTNGDVILGKGFKIILNEKLTFGDILFFDFEEDMENLKKSLNKSLITKFLKFLKLIPKYYSRHMIIDTSRKIANYSLRADKEEYHTIMEFKL